MNLDHIELMDALQYAQSLPGESVNCVVTSPPYYGLRDYEVQGQIGLEETPEEFIDKLVSLFREIRRVLRSDGVCWVNMGDSYANDNKWGGSTGGKHSNPLHGKTKIGRVRKFTGLPFKSLMLIPHKLAIALQQDGWIVRMDVPWIKRNVLPEAVEDRATKAHEYVFMLTKTPHYWTDMDAVRRKQSGTAHSRGKGSAKKQGERGLNRNNESWNTSCTKYVDVPGGRNLRTSDLWTDSIEARIAALRAELEELEAVQQGQGVLTDGDAIAAFVVNTVANRAAHFAMYPLKLVEPMILSTCPSGGIVYDPFMGSGTTALAVRRLGGDRHFIGNDINPEYIAIANRRLEESFQLQLI